MRKKLQLLDPDTDGHVKSALESVLGEEDVSLVELQQALRPLFVRFFATLCQEEGVDRLTSVEQEEGLKDRLPDTVANWLSVLSEVLTLPQPTERVADPAYTAPVLLLRLHEWINLNYHGRYVYGADLEEEAQRLFRTLENEMDLMGDKDEILAMTMEGLSGFCDDYTIDETTLLPGVGTYFVEIRFDYGRGVRALRVGIKSVLVDQTKFRALCPDQHILSHILENLFALSSIGISPPGNYI